MSLPMDVLGFTVGNPGIFSSLASGSFMIIIYQSLNKLPADAWCSLAGASWVECPRWSGGHREPTNRVLACCDLTSTYAQLQSPLQT